jgi:hypothetical protein
MMRSAQLCMGFVLAMFIAYGAANSAPGDIQAGGGGGSGGNATFATTAGSANNANNVVAGGNVNTNAVNANSVFFPNGSKLTDVVNGTLLFENSGGTAGFQIFNSGSGVNFSGIGGAAINVTAGGVVITSRFQAPLGSAAVPPYTNSTTTNTGIYFPTATSVGFATNGNLVLTLDANRNATFNANETVAGNLYLPNANTVGTSALYLGPTTALGTRIFQNGTGVVQFGLADGSGNAKLYGSGAYSTNPGSASAVEFGRYNQLGYGAWFDSTHMYLAANGNNTLILDANQQAIFNGNIVLPLGGIVQEANVNAAPGIVKGVQFTDTALLLGNTSSAAAGVILANFSGSLAISDESGQYSKAFLGGVISHGAYQVSGSSVTTGSIYQLSNGGGFGNVDANHTTVYSYNGTAATPAVNFDTAQNANFAGNVTIPGTLNVPGAAVNAAGSVPTVVDTNMIYVREDFLGWAAGSAKFTGVGSVSSGGIGLSGGGANTASQAMGLNIGNASASTGGYISASTAIPVSKSATITWQWRIYFMFPTNVYSTAANRYTFYVGGYRANTSAPYAPTNGPYISYSDNVNSGNWLLGSATGGTLTTANSAVGAPALASWNALTITLVNGTYTYILNGVTLGTVTDTNITTTPASGSTSAGGAITLINGGAWTTLNYTAVNAWDLLITGLNR